MNNSVKKLLRENTNNTKFSFVLAGLLLVLFLGIALTIPFRDNLLSLLYPKNPSKAAGLPLLDQSVFERKDFLYGTVIGGWKMDDGRYDGHPALNYGGKYPHMPQIFKELKSPVVRWQVGDGLTTTGGSVPPDQFDNVIDGIRNTLGAYPIIKFNPSPVSLCPLVIGNGNEELGLQKLLEINKAIIDQAGPRVQLYESTNEMDYACSYQHPDVPQGLGFDHWYEAPQAVTRHWIYMVPKLKQHARSKGFEIFIGGPGGIDFSGLQHNPSEWHKFNHFEEFNKIIKAEYDRTNNADLIPSFVSTHIYGRHSSGDLPPTETISFYNEILSGYRTRMNSIWGPVLGPQIKLAISEWNTSDRVHIDGGTGFNTYGADYYKQFLQMLRNNDVWLANQFTFSSNDPGDPPYDQSEQFVNMVERDGTKWNTFYAFKEMSLNDPLANASRNSTQATPTTSPTPAAKVSVPYRVNAGGPSKTDTSGSTWNADAYFNDGQTVDRGAITISGTTNQFIYQTERYGMSGYSFPINNGTYQVKLHFAETFSGVTTAGQRIFDVAIEGQPVLPNFDIFSQAGGTNTALVKTFQASVSDGVLNITFTKKTENPEINGIEILSTTTNTPTLTPTPTPSYRTDTSPFTGVVSMCGISNFAWTVGGALARSAQPADWQCLKNNGFTTIIQQNTDAGTAEKATIESLGMTYIGSYGIPDDTAYSPTMIQTMMADIVSRMRKGERILVHDSGGRGRMGFWEATFLLWDGWTSKESMDRYDALGWKINGVSDGNSAWACPQGLSDPTLANGSNGQYQGMQAIAQALGQPVYDPSPDTYGNRWANCALPSYMSGWNYSSITWPTGKGANWAKTGKVPTSTPTTTPQPTFPGDANGDNKVDLFDYNVLIGEFGKTGTNLQSDFTKDGKVDLFDYNILIGNFGKTQ